MEIKHFGEATPRNDRERALVGIFNNEMEDLERYITQDNTMGKTLRRDEDTHWYIVAMWGTAKAMFWLGITGELITPQAIWEAATGSRA